MQPETYLLRFHRIEAKTPTNFVKQIFFRFFPSPKNGEKERKNIGPISANFLSYHLLIDNFLLTIFYRHGRPFLLISYDKNLLQFLFFFYTTICQYKVWEVFKDPVIHESLVNNSQKLAGCGNDCFAAASRSLNPFIIPPQIGTVPFG
jgi:hypothetical protein